MYEYIILFVGTILMLLAMAAANRKVRLPFPEMIICAILLLPLGIFSAKVMRVIEAQTWEGYSFYGDVFLVPLFMIVISYILRIDKGKLLDLCAPAGCIMLACMKVNCIIVGCCRGRILGYDKLGNPVRFPSQIVELITGLVLMVIMYGIIYSGKQAGMVYAWFMLLYGITRFILNLFRETNPYFFGISAGCFWSIIAVVTGSFLIIKNIEKIENKSVRMIG